MLFFTLLFSSAVLLGTQINNETSDITAVRYETPLHPPPCNLHPSRFFICRVFNAPHLSGVRLLSEPLCCKGRSSFHCVAT